MTESTTTAAATSTTGGAPFERRTVTAAGFDVAVLEAGDGVPLVCLHGGGGPRLSPALDLLARRFRVLLIELPGWGAQPNDAAATVDDLAAQVAAIIEALGLPSYHLLGTSLGGVCALHLALAHPERVISLTLEAPALFRADSADPSTLAPEVLAKALRTHPERGLPIELPAPELVARIGPLVGRLLGDGSLDDTLAARLAALPTRTLVLFGRDDGIVNPVNGPTYKRLLPNSTLLYVHDAAHDIQNDRPEAFADVVGDFVTRGMNFLINETDGLINP